MPGSLLFLALFVLLASQFLMPSAFAQDDFGEIVVGVPANFPPQYYVDEETGEPYGFAIDVMDEIAARSGLNIRYVVFDTWPEVNEAIKVGQIDVQPNVGIIDERIYFMDFTSPVETFYISIFVRSTTIDIQNIDDLAGKKVAVVENNKGLYIMEEYGGADLVIYNSVEEAFFSLISGNTDALVYPEPTILKIASMGDLGNRIKVVGEPLLEVKRGIGVREGQTDLFNVLDKEVKSFVETSEYGEIYAKWYGEPDPYWSSGRVAAGMGILLFLIVLFFAGWHYFSTIRMNRLLRSSIAEREQAEEKLTKYTEELAKAYEDLKSLDKMKDEFLSNVSHELKTPLVSIEGYSELIRDETLGALNEKQKKAMDAVMRNSDRLERLIDSILYLSIEEAGRMRYTFKPLRITDVIEKSVSDMLPQINRNNITIKKEVQDDLSLIQADEDRIMQVMVNLIGNSIKFTPSGGITITAREDDNNLHVEVSDTGVGISKEHVINLFDRFYQVDASTKRKYGGTGLGLHISKLIVEAHNGKIWVESKEGVGTTIHFTLPK